jgi:hypothetical protein
MTVAAAAVTGGHASPWTIVLIGLAAAVIWVASLYVKPYTSCRWCRDHPGRNTRGRSYGHCWRCKGEPERLRFGARLVHRASSRRRKDR